jgi:hypothetical protein
MKSNFHFDSLLMSYKLNLHRHIAFFSVSLYFTISSIFYVT